ncbi:hypothetical protein LX15_004242 [Streptoalloteichus tenebrarius]|uniref:Uncharacterized protein n=1 Tax=Streptoalloteichus tenebrarius (strain ATCC 17920 / DSM 40477 / JCM 4838 / CBS 697.72 / NBRC 16177 / NCIMB 11028 / NRRL B-12390 / A12253. 1 / ISP 5477) TaxID=1933 RepID=A0ABT1HYC5_STRSD|nr:hypothetical protein [Streptoalloteichus tenebrarius]MCP2260524.1 hypothetical protein [Streptoalloteichus tenebrarius]BFF01864.1 hypothetical protein GCM10020241_35390 [Streptoalloteichus tenebrarius]
MTRTLDSEGFVVTRVDDTAGTDGKDDTEEETVGSAGREVTLADGSSVVGSLVLDGPAGVDGLDVVEAPGSAGRDVSEVAAGVETGPDVTDAAVDEGASEPVNDTGVVAGSPGEAA